LIAEDRQIFAERLTGNLKNSPEEIEANFEEM